MIEYVMVMHDGGRSTRFMSEDYCKDLLEQLAAAQSREVCTVAHENVETCGYCQRDALLGEVVEKSTALSRALAGMGEARADRDALTAENAALRKDAERYLWLRDRQWPFEFHGNNAEDADVAIDAAMALTKKLARKHTPECSYWDGLMAQVCNCGVDAAMGEKP
jgi:hypothetical protein